MVGTGNPGAADNHQRQAGGGRRLASERTEVHFLRHRVGPLFCRRNRCRRRQLSALSRHALFHPHRSVVTLPTFKIRRRGDDPHRAAREHGSTVGRYLTTDEAVALGRGCQVGRCWEDAVVAANLWTLNKTSHQLGCDGATWLLAGRRGFDFHHVGCWSPRDAPFDLGRLQQYSVWKAGPKPFEPTKGGCSRQ